jgi:hypothetical protein
MTPAIAPAGSIRTSQIKGTIAGVIGTLRAGSNTWQSGNASRNRSSPPM